MPPRAPRRSFGALLIPLAGAGLLLAACEGSRQEFPTRNQGDTTPSVYGERESIFGPGGLDIFADSTPPEGTGGGSGIAVNSYLWRASLDTISFMPLSSADPFGGVIITDWYSPPESPDERFKINVFILGRDLRADGVKVAVFRQTSGGAVGWADSPVDPDTATDLEDAILARARELRIAGTG